MAGGAVWARRSDVPSLGDALKWDHWPQTHLDTHAKPDHTRILMPGGFSSCSFPLPVSQLTVLLNTDIQNWTDCFRWGNAAVTWYSNCSFHQVPREGQYWKHISFISCFPCTQNLFKMCSHCSNIRLPTISFLAEMWEKTEKRPAGGWRSCESVLTELSIFETVFAFIKNPPKKQRSDGYYVRYNPESECVTGVQTWFGYQFCAESK